MRLDIVVWLRDMDTNGGIYRETLHLCKSMLPDYPAYQTIARVNQVQIREMIREWKLKFTVHCIRMPTDEPINRLVLYESKERPSLRPGARTKTYKRQISSHLSVDEQALEAT